jgi:hypothetical protein
MRLPGKKYERLRHDNYIFIITVLYGIQKLSRNVRLQRTETCVSRDLPPRNVNAHTSMVSTCSLNVQQQTEELNELQQQQKQQLQQLQQQQQAAASSSSRQQQKRRPILD